ncbi:MAG: hypothetical protein AB7S51_09645 [Porticoccaceae bacterium]
MTELVHALGFELGRDLLGARPDNPRGLWENAAVVSVSESLLADAASAWYDPGFLELSELLDPEAIRAALAAVIGTQFGAPGGSVVIKDPRLCRAARPCAAALRQMGYRVRFVLALRDPRASAESLYRRDGVPRAVGIALWLAYILGALQAVRGQEAVLLSYEALLADDAVLADLAAWLHGGARPGADELADLRACIVPDLRHSRAAVNPELESEPLAALADVVFATLNVCQSPLVGAAQLAAWTQRFRAQVTGPRWLGWRRVVVMHQPQETECLPAGLLDTLARQDAGLLLIRDGCDDPALSRELPELAAAGRIGLFFNLCARGEAASLVRGISLVGAARQVILVRSGALAVLGEVLAWCAAQPYPVELVSTEGASLALSLPAAVASGLDVWAHVDTGDAAWDAVVNAVDAAREVLVRGPH